MSTKLLKAQVIDELTEQFDYGEIAVLSCVEKKDKFNEEFIDENIRYFNALEKVWELYDDSNLIDSESQIKYKNLYKALKWEVKAIEILKIKKGKPNLEDIEALLKEWEDSKELLNNFKEKQMLEQLANSCRAWLDKY